MVKALVTYTDGEVFTVEDVARTDSDVSTYFLISGDGTTFVIPKANVKRIVVESGGPA